MDLRLALHDLAAQHRLDAADTRRLHQLAKLDAEPAALARLLPRGMAVLAAALGGLGRLFRTAANWDTLGRFGRSALLQGVFLAACAGAPGRPAAVVPAFRVRSPSSQSRSLASRQAMEPQRAQ